MISYNKIANVLLHHNFLNKSDLLVKHVQPLNNLVRHVQTVTDRVLEKSRTSKLGKQVGGAGVTEPEERKPFLKYSEASRDFRYIYPDFLPNPVYYFRDKLREKLERTEMINRRKVINMPEFYVGSIMAVTVSDPYGPGKLNRFVGICVKREGYGLRHTFTLRNVVDGLGVEILYDLYNPTIQKIDVLKLEKRLDEDLSYLRDSPAEYSTIPFDFEPVVLPPGAKVPLNEIKIKLNPKPWTHKWELKFLKGALLPKMARFEHELWRKNSSDFKPFERYDVMKHYRDGIHDDDLRPIVEDVKKFEEEQELKKEKAIGSRKLKRSRTLPGQQ